MSIELDIRPTTVTEDMYTYTQSSQLQGQTGCIGYLRADMDSNGNGFFSSWNGLRDYLKTEEFKAEFDEVINELRFGEEENFLKNRSELSHYCWSHPTARMEGNEDNFGFRVDTEKYTYMMRLNPNKGMYNLYCYCYRRDWLDQHLHNAARGIRFIDSHYNDLFKVPDGGKVRVTYYDGEVRDVTCRYIDEYHLEFGYGSCNLFHICELAEKMENNGNKLEPIDVMPEPEKKARHKEDAR